jgi:hypothetical protein
VPGFLFRAARLVPKARLQAGCDHARYRASTEMNNSKKIVSSAAKIIRKAVPDGSARSFLISCRPGGVRTLIEHLLDAELKPSIGFSHGQHYSKPGRNSLTVF